MNKYVCIHGHFYQPPRENPWLEEIEVQDSAYPFRDWNERITAECYNPNTAARILNPDGVITQIVNNYSKISFNFGPTLLSWMKQHVPDVYQSILLADQISLEKFSGHGSAIAQVYNHLIMPLANKRDKISQVIWGIEDFKYRFNRFPEGMWLSETAADIETLEVLAEQKIKYTILAPRQAAKVKHFDEDDWTDVSDSKVDPKKAYLCKLPSGKTINLFFYDGAVSQELAFGNLLESGENLVNRLLGTFSNEERPQLVNIATDGETYGHHQKNADMALAYCLHLIEENEDIQISNYGEFLEKFPPSHEVQIFENTSWSCVHGVERWRSDCGCNAGHNGWNQQWRAPLRESLDWLRNKISPIYEKEISKFTNDPWRLRDDYIQVILNREPEVIKQFLENHSIEISSNEDRVKILKLLEIQRHAMLIYTSCGWFFDEVSGIETVQVLKYAARIIQLLKELELDDLEEEFEKLLEKIPSNIPELGNGAKVYEKYVKPAIVDLLRVAAHYAISSMFEEYKKEYKIYAYEVFNEDYDLWEAGKRKMLVGRAKMRSQITYDEDVVSFAFLHLGDHNLYGGVRNIVDNNSYASMKSEMKAAFDKLNIAEIILSMDKYFGNHSYNLWHLFKDERRNVFNKIMSSTLEEIEFYFDQIYKANYPIMQVMRESDTPLPKAISTQVEFILNKELQHLLENKERISIDKLMSTSEEMKKWNVELDRALLSYTGSQRINDLMELLQTNYSDIELLKKIYTSLKVFNDLNIELDIWKAQNILFIISQEHYNEMKQKADSCNQTGKDWIKYIHNIENYLRVKIA